MLLYPADWAIIIHSYLKFLHYLSVSVCIDFKILLLVFEALHGIASAYLSDILVKYEPAMLLRYFTSSKVQDKIFL